ncbi:MAG: hypothetical protein AAF950_12505 [Pseudomonadota bacterium]
MLRYKILIAAGAMFAFAGPAVAANTGYAPAKPISYATKTIAVDSYASFADAELHNVKFHGKKFHGKKGFHGKSFHGRKSLYGHRNFHGKGFHGKGFYGKKGFHGKGFARHGGFKKF